MKIPNEADEKRYQYYSENINTLSKKQLLELVLMQQTRITALDEYFMQSESIQAMGELLVTGAVIH